jgi:hypothetical protein
MDRLRVLHAYVTRVVVADPHFLTLTYVRPDNLTEWFTYIRDTPTHFGRTNRGSVPAAPRENGRMPQLVNTGIQLQLHDLAGKETIKWRTINTPRRWHG